MIPTIRNGIQMAFNDISVISHNLANASTNGYKRSRSEFYDSYGQGMNSLPNVDLGHGARTDGPIRNFSQGAIKSSGSELDLAISGVGMFGTVKREDGIQDALDPDADITYTRDGSFRLDVDGTVVTTDGRAVLGPGGGVMRVPLTQIDANGNRQFLTALNIQDDGTFEGTYGDGSIINLGRVALFDFINLGGLTSIGNGHFKVSAKSGPALVGQAREGTFGRVLAGNLEAANVNVTDEMTKLMKAQQAYSGSSRLLQAAVDMTKRLIG
jgi:flagellar basal-body rod protein FlgG